MNPLHSLGGERSHISSDISSLENNVHLSSFLKILYYNARSLIPKMDELTLLATVHIPDVICIVETWLDGDINDTEISIPGYHSQRLDRNRHGGGVLMYIKDIFHYSILPKPIDALELVSVVVQHNTIPTRICVSVFYRPPSSQASVLDDLCTCFETIDITQFVNVVVVGDFNIDVSSSSHPLYHKLSSMMSTYSMFQMVNDHTHTHHNGTNSTIDLLYASNPSLINDCITIPALANSDHLGLLIHLCLKVTNSIKTKTRAVWRYRLADWDRACELIEATDWKSILDYSDINKSWNNWKSALLNIMEECIPRATLPPRRNRPWLTKKLIQAMRRRNCLYKRAKATGNYSKYRSYRNKVVGYLRQAKKAFFQKLNPKNPKQFWKVCKSLNSIKSTIPTLVHNDVTAHSNVQKAEMLNTFFATCFNKSQPPVESTDFRISTPPDVLPSELLCSEDEIFDLLSLLDVNKSNGPDGISARMLKYTASSITPAVTMLFNLSLKLGRVPSCWKRSYVVPIPKTPAARSPDNYRPISLLSILSKVLERHVFKLVNRELDELCPLSDVQWGFRAGRSTTSALLSTTSHWFELLEEGKDICAVFFDYRKAFDSVPHWPLLRKLISLNVNQFLIQWIADYLTSRTQQVVIEGESSTVEDVLSGVPQGSVLGPLLFLIYIDEVGTIPVTQESVRVMFADDLLLYRPISQPNDFLAMQEDVSKVEEWSIANYLSLNPIKCKCMIISRKTSPLQPESALTLNGHILAQVDVYKYLGILLSKDLSWSPHVDVTCSKARKVLGLLYRRFYKFSNLDTIRQLYTSLVRPHLEYACHVWSPYTSRDINALESVQKFACKMASRRWNGNTYEELLTVTNLPTLERRRLELKLRHLFKIIHNLVFFPSNIFVPRERSQYHLRSSHDYCLTQPFARTNSYFYSFVPYTISIWNSLPAEAVSLSSINSFKSYLHRNYIQY